MPVRSAAGLGTVDVARAIPECLCVLALAPLHATSRLRHRLTLRELLLIQRIPIERACVSCC